MRIGTVRIQHFRSFDDATLDLADYTCLVGPNGSGKSTVLCALNVFFRETANAATDLTCLGAEDFHQKNTAQPVQITVTFTDLEDGAKHDLADYHRQGRLVVSAVASFDNATGKAEVKQYGQRLGMAAFKGYFRAQGDGAKVGDLRDIYTKLCLDFPQLPKVKTESDMTRALRDFENARPDECELIPSGDQFYGFSRGTNRLAKYIQWVHVPAVKDATAEQTEARNTALGKLLARTVRARSGFEDQVQELRAETRRRYQGLLDRNQSVLAAISASLGKRLAEWAHPGAAARLEWKEDPEASVRINEPFAQIIAMEDGFEGELARFGHGLQRSYLLALLQELATFELAQAPRLILACEEPELYQHPPQARHLIAVLEKLGQGNAQVLVSTHSPLFVSGAGFESVRMVRKESGSGASRVSRASFDQVAELIGRATEVTPLRPEGLRAKLNQALRPHLNEMFFTPRLVLVEGPEDVAYITTVLMLLGKWEEYRGLRCHVVPTNGKFELLEALAVAKLLEIPTFVVFDSDASRAFKDSGDKHKHVMHNKAILGLCGAEDADPMPTETLWREKVVMWHSDIGSVVADEVGGAEWKRFQENAAAIFGHARGLEKNSMYIAELLTAAWNAGKRFPSLERACEGILKCARGTSVMVA